MNVRMISGIAALATAALSAHSARAAVPIPTVIGPIPATANAGDPSHNYPFFSTMADLRGHGYIEQEFFFEGMANTYSVDPLAPTKQTAVITGSGYAYRTRMIVRRPLSADAFNGTVLIEWQNVTGGYEPDALWIQSHDHLMRRGCAWVGISAQRAGIHTPVSGLRAWNADRYGTLNIPSTGAIMSDADGLSWDIFSQGAQAVRHSEGTDPMGGLQVQRAFAVGWSQGAVRLANYFNSIHPLARVFDAFGLIGLDGRVLVPLRTDAEVQDVKVFKVQPETNVAGNGQGISQALLRQEEPDTEFFRRWEVAGATQLGYYEAQQTASLQARDLSPSSSPTCVFPPYSRIPIRFVVNAAYDHMVSWVKHNTAPPVGQDIEVTTFDFQSTLTRDSFGNVLGGIRLSQHAVPTATNTGLNRPVASVCRYVGTYVQFAQDLLDQLYPDHETYLSQVIAATHETQRLGFIGGADAAATIRDAAKSDIGRR